METKNRNAVTSSSGMHFVLTAIFDRDVLSRQEIGNGSIKWTNELTWSLAMGLAFLSTALKHARGTVGFIGSDCCFSQIGKMEWKMEVNSLVVRPIERNASLVSAGEC